MAPQKPFKYSSWRSPNTWFHLPPRFCTGNMQGKSCRGMEGRATARKWLHNFLGIQKCSAHKSGSSLCGMRSDGNPARLWPATQRHFLCPWGSGLPARAISFMENSGLFSGFIKIDEKTNKTHGFEHFTCNPLRDPHFQKICTKINQWDHGPESIFPSTKRQNLPPCFDPGLLLKICYSILQLQQVLVHEDTEAKKLMGGNGVCNWRP